VKRGRRNAEESTNTTWTNIASNDERKRGRQKEGQKERVRKRERHRERVRKRERGTER